jgi:hypothetical protein
MTSADNVTWTVVRDNLKPDNLPSYDFDFDPPVNVRVLLGCYAAGLSDVSGEIWLCCG